MRIGDFKACSAIRNPKSEMEKDLMFAVGFFDWGLGNADGGIYGRAPQSAIRNPKRRVFDKSRNAAIINPKSTIERGMRIGDLGFF